MKKRWLVMLMAAAMMMTVTACGGGSSAETTAAATTAATTAAETTAAKTEAEKEETEAEEEAEAAGETIEVPVTVINGSGVEIYEFYMSSSGTEEWGEDLLGDVTMPDATYLELVLTVDSENLLWDFSAVDSDGNALEWYEIDISEMPADGFGIELLWDGSDGYSNLAADPSELLGDYSPAAEAEEAAGEEEESDVIVVADASEALAGTVWVDESGNVYGFEEDGETLYLTTADGTEMEGSYVLAAGDNGVVAMTLTVEEYGIEIEAVLTGISEDALEFTDINSGEPAVFVPVA